MNFKLKGKVVEMFGSQCAAARAMGIKEWKLSRLIHGWDAPTDEEIEIFERILGEKTTRGIFDKSANGGCEG